MCLCHNTKDACCRALDYDEVIKLIAPIQRFADVVTKSDQTRFPMIAIAGLVLAGGEGRRMGGDKPFRQIGGRPLIAMAVENAGRHCDPVMISSNQPPETFAVYEAKVVADIPKAGQGPLGGVLGGLTALPDGVDWLVTFPVDCPVVPHDMAATLVSAAHDAGVRAAFARHGDRDHYLSSAWHRESAPVIAKLLADDDRRVRAPLQALDAVAVTFPRQESDLAMFANANTIDDLAELEKMLAARPSKGM